MARAKVTTTTYTRTKVPTRNGGYRYKMQKSGKTVTKATNQAKGAGVQQVFKGNKANLAAKEIQKAENIAKAKILGRNTDVATITSGIASTIQQGFGRIQPTNTAQRDISKVGASNSAVEQAVNGGVAQAGSSRNDDEDDESPYID